MEFSLEKSELSQNQTAEFDILKETQLLVQNKTQQERFYIAKKHLFNALDFKTPRIDIYKQKVSKTQKLIYYFQTNYMWRIFTKLLAYTFMYAAFFGHVNPTPLLLCIEFVILFILMIDVFLEIFHKRCNLKNPSSQFSPRFFVRTITIIILIIDSVIAAQTTQLPVRPFLILRCILPVIYDHQIRKMFYALASSYVDIFVYVLFYSFVIVGFAIIANQIIELPPSTVYDEFKQNYGDLGKAIFIMYVISTFDAYPDNQIIAIKQRIEIYGYFILFVFLNQLLFTTIPTNILFNSIKKIRSRTIIIDQIKQQQHLIMAFIVLGGSSKTSVSYEKIITFLLYVFNNQVKHLDKITQICRKLDEKVNGTIQVNQFMQICKIIQSKNYLMPPRYTSFKKYKYFKSYLHNRFQIQQLIKSKKFEIFVGFLVFLGFINSFFVLYTKNEIFVVLDDIFMVVFTVQVLFKLVGLGPSDFFFKYMNTLDFAIVTASIILQLSDQGFMPKNAPVIFKMFRIYRTFSIITKISELLNLQYKSQILQKLLELFNQIILIIPIIFKFFPLYVISFYFLGTIGVQFFWSQTQLKSQDTPYGAYDEYSNFKSLLGSQFVFVQVFAQAGWSSIAYDHALRYGHFLLVMLFFVVCHQVIVLLLASLFRGIAWEVFDAINQENLIHNHEMAEEKSISNALKKRYQQFQQARQKIQKHTQIIPDNLIVRQLIQKRIDQQIMKKILQMQIKSQILINRKKKSPNKTDGSKQNFDTKSVSNKRKVLGVVNNNKKYLFPITEKSDSILPLQPSQKSKQNFSLSAQPQSHYQIIHNQSVGRFSLTQQRQSSQNYIQFQNLKEEDIQKEIDGVLSQISIRSEMNYSLKIENSRVFNKYLKQKLKTLQIKKYNNQFNVDQDLFAKKESLNYLLHGLQTLLNLQTTQRQQKALVLKQMVNKGIITQKQANKFLTQKSQLDEDISFDSDWIIRQTFLSNTNEDIINQFQIQYFSEVYGKSFKDINKITVEPLMKMESRLQYCFSNLLRYRQISTYQFFNTLIHIESKVSTKLYQTGSLFKFIFQIQDIGSWFTVQLKDSNQLRIHFIKNGIWISNQNIEKDDIYTARDIFNCQRFCQQLKSEQKEECIKNIKSFYQSFQSLAFCINDFNTFFKPNPQQNVHDLYSFYRNVGQSKRYVKKKLQISKIMIVLLSKQVDRQKPLSYKLSDLKYDQQLIQQQERKKQNFSKLDQTQSQLFQRLKKLDLNLEQTIGEKQGLPFCHTINFFMNIREAMILNQRNFVFHAQKLLNQHMQQVQKKQKLPKVQKKTSLLQRRQFFQVYNESEGTSR